MITITLRIPHFMLALIALAACAFLCSQVRPRDTAPEGYMPPVRLNTSNVMHAYYARTFGETADEAEIYVPAYSTFDFADGIPAMDLKDLIGHVSKEYPEFEELAIQMASWEFPRKLDTLASAELAMVHAFCQDLKGKYPECDSLGDVTSLKGMTKELLIFHPNNVPCMAVLINPSDDLGMALTSAGTITGILEELPEDIDEPAAEPGSGAAAAPQAGGGS